MQKSTLIALNDHISPNICSITDKKKEIEREREEEREKGGLQSSQGLFESNKIKRVQRKQNKNNHTSQKASMALVQPLAAVSRVCFKLRV